MGQCHRKSHGTEAAYGSAPPAGSTSSSSQVLPSPSDDAISSVCPFGDRHFVASGSNGWVYFYDWQKATLDGKFRAHKKAVNQARTLDDGRLLTASNDSTVRLWAGSGNSASALPIVAQTYDAGSAAGCLATPALTFEGHDISVVAMDLLDGASTDVGGPSASSLLVTGSRDCSLRAWDLETGRELRKLKILRNVVTTLRRLPGSSSSIVQASEDLQLRLWDLSASGNQPASAVHAGPNQLICLDVSEDGRYVACGSKGFSRENCEVKVFDVRGGLRELSSKPCADQTIEALRFAGPDRCLIASKDGFLRVVQLPEVSIVSERGPAGAGYTALGACRRSMPEGPVALSALSGPDGVRLEVLAWRDAVLESPASLLAATETE